MDTPLKSLGIELNGCRLTKKQLTAWTNANTPHVVPLYTGGGIFTSEGNGIYESADFKFYSVEEFWQFARGYKNVVMWRG